MIGPYLTVPSHPYSTICQRILQRTSNKLHFLSSAHPYRNSVALPLFAFFTGEIWPSEGRLSVSLFTDMVPISYYYRLLSQPLTYFGLRICFTLPWHCNLSICNAKCRRVSACIFGFSTLSPSNKLFPPLPSTATFLAQSRGLCQSRTIALYHRVLHFFQNIYKLSPFFLLQRATIIIKRQT